MGDTELTVDDGSKIPAILDSEKLFVEIGGEEVWIKARDGNSITVERGQDSTTPVSHIKGTAVKSITAADNALIEEGDDFGFDGTTDSWT